MKRGKSREAITEPPKDAKPMEPFRSRGIGRATTLADLPADWKDIILTEMAEGASELEIKALLRIGNSTHQNWMTAPDEGRGDDFLEYRDTMYEGRALCQAWWERAGRKNLQNAWFNNTLWYMNMKNRFGWKDRNEVTNLDPERAKDMKEAIKLGATTIVF